MIVRNLDRRRWRAFFAALAVALSVAIVVSGRYSIDAVNRLVSVQFHTVQREDVTVVFQEPRPASARYDLAQLAGVLRVEPYREVPARLRLGHRSRRVGYWGCRRMANCGVPWISSCARLSCLRMDWC